MGDGEITAGQFGRIIQVIGIAYTYQPSLAVRRHLLHKTSAYHSSKYRSFSYFYKGDSRSIVGHGQELFLRSDPATCQLAKHWPEPELAVILGEYHEIIAYTLANDLTAITLEARGRTNESDGTYAGKVWSGSGSLGPRFVEASAVGDPSQLTIGLVIARQGNTIYNQRYSTSRHLHPFEEIPDMVVAYSKQFDEPPPPSKRITINNGGFLPAGTVIMLGTGLIVQQRYFCELGDQLTVYCPNIGELTNTLVTSIPS